VVPSFWPLRGHPLGRAGSVLKLNTDSAVEVRFTADERRVELVRGEVFFTVTKNPRRPFVVHAGQVAVRAVGTAFDVRMRPQAIEVLVSEGKVQVNDTVSGASLLAVEPTETGEVPAGGPLLVAGKRAIIPVQMAARAPAEVETVEPETIARALAWQKRQLQFATATLAEMTAEFNRYNRHQLVIADARLAELQLGGTFPAGDYEVFVQLLEANFEVVAERRENETVLRFAR
jgi:transmembrane sensor